MYLWSSYISYFNIILKYIENDLYFKILCLNISAYSPLKQTFQSKLMKYYLEQTNLLCLLSSKNCEANDGFLKQIVLGVT